MKLKLILFFLLGVVIAQAQSSYTYITDRKFNGPDDLLGYYFRPNHMEVPNDYDRDLESDEYAFGITPSNLYVDGEEGIKGVYNINNINSTEYGFKLLLMNPRNPAEQGHLKIILTPQKFVDALVFKRSKKEPEIIFFLPEMPDHLWEKETAYFTDRKEFHLESPDSLWGQSVFPFLILQNNGLQQRLKITDSTEIHFREIITIVEKEKKKKKKKEMESDSLNMETIQSEEELETLLDDELAEELADAALFEGEEEEEKNKDVKIKITKEYFLDIRFYAFTNEGTKEERNRTYSIKKVVEKEDEAAGPDEERFQIEISLNKGDPIYMYLTGRRTISSIEIEENVYLMRGH